ncbi:hypothetical protein QZH41_015919 [Actinostola sp. cb2023]|nr:hypothetical protein QZH41_015919 [Actinostola sp. cb2023]
MATLCGICKQNYKDPRVLPCLHSFCKKCIGNVFAENREETLHIFCPSCNTKFNITPDEVQKLPKNFGITNLLPIIKLHSSGEDKAKKLECENCQGKKAAVGRCNDCSEFMCSFCIAAHQRMQTLKRHTVVSLEMVKRAEPCNLAKQLCCQTHEQEPLKLYCESCHVPICRDCTIFDHQNHKYKKIEEVIHREKREIAVAINEAAYKIPTLENTLKDVRNMELRVKKKALMAEKDVDTFIDTQIRVLQQIRTEFKSGVDTVYKAKLYSLKTQEQHASQHLSNIKTGVQFARQAISNGSDCEVLSVKKQIVTRLMDLCEKNVYPTPCQDDGIALCVDSKRTIRDLIPQLARLDSTTAMASSCSLHVVGGDPGIMYTTFCSQSCEFVITLRDHLGQRLRTGDSRVLAAITECPFAQREVWGTNMKFLSITDNDDGTYNISHLPLFPGKYILSVAVDRCHIRGSPFCWYVSQKMVNINECRLESMFTNSVGMFQASSTTIDDIVIDGCYCFSWRVKFRSNLYPSITGESSPLDLRARSSRSLASQQSFFQGCKIGVRKSQQSLTNSETSFASTGENSLSRDDSLNYNTWRDLVRDGWFWCDGFCYSPEDPSGSPSSITSFVDGDIFVLFLDPIKKTLIIYNRESEQKDCFEGIEFPVCPYLKG